MELSSLGRFLQRGENAETFAFAATLLCVWVSAQLVVMLPNKTPRIFTAVALFGLNWAILLLYYLPGPPQNEILAAFSGYVLVYVGILLLREVRESQSPAETHSLTWLDTLPVHLFRITVGGFGLYLVVQRLFRIQYGYGTLAVAVWATLLTILGYTAVWLGTTILYRGSGASRKVALWLGLLLAAYSACEIAYCVWYARDYWPPYHRFLALETSPKTPDFETLLPFAPQPDWPDYAQWTALRTRPDWPRLRGLLGLQVTPNLPDMWLWLKYAFSLLKVLFTGAFLVLMWRRPAHVAAPSGFHRWRWLEERLGLTDGKAS